MTSNDKGPTLARASTTVRETSPHVLYQLGTLVNSEQYLLLLVLPSRIVGDRVRLSDLQQPRCFLILWCLSSARSRCIVRLMFIAWSHYVTSFGIILAWLVARDGLATHIMFL